MEFHYKEMVRLAAIFDWHSKDAFNDFKLLGAVGTLLSWGPLSSSFKQIQPETMLLGFLAILAVTGLVGLFALMRQSVVNYQIKELIFLKHKSANTCAAQNWRLSGCGARGFLGKDKTAAAGRRLLFAALFHFRAMSIVYPKGDFGGPLLAKRQWLDLIFF